MTLRPGRSGVHVWEEEDVVAKARDRLKGVFLKGLRARQEKRHDSGPRLQPVNAVGGDTQADGSATAGCRRFHFGLRAEDDRNEQTVPSAPGVEGPAVNLEPVWHLAHREAAEADDLAFLICVGEAPEIRVPQQLLDRARRSLEGPCELRSRDRLTMRELAVDLEPAPPLLPG